MTLDVILAGVIWTHAVVIRPAGSPYDWEYFIWTAQAG